MKLSHEQTNLVLDELSKEKILNINGDLISINETFGDLLANVMVKNHCQNPYEGIFMALIEHFEEIHEDKLEQYFRCLEGIFNAFSFQGGK